MLNKLFKSFRKNKSGAIAIMFALMAPIIVGATGMALDYARAYLVQQRLASALDAAALAAVASSSSEAEIEARIIEFFEINFPPDELGVAFDPEVNFTENGVEVTGSATYYTSFLNILGIEEMPVQAYTVVRQEIQGIEVALVLDVTGSMGTANRIGALRTAATNFVDIMYANAGAITSVKIGLVPFASSVNVGPYGIGEDLDGNYYDTPFVNNPDNFAYNTGAYDAWRGCVLAYDNPLDTEDHEGPWDIYRIIAEGQSFNTGCNNSHIIPLTSDTVLLYDRINALSPSGATLGNIGMVWGYRVLSPEFPFQEASPWENDYIRRTAVVMTDGQNVIGGYSAYGYSSDHDITASVLNDGFAETCENMKDDGITVYTITFSSGASSDTIQNLFGDCATSSSHYFDAPEEEDLVEVFETIARELSYIHISQ